MNPPCRRPLRGSPDVAVHNASTAEALLQWVRRHKKALVLRCTFLHLRIWVSVLRFFELYRMLVQVEPNAISHRGDIPWPARSPDLAPCDFFLWAHLKAEVYKHRPHALGELKTAIREETAAIPPDMTARVKNNFRKRLDICIRSQGRHKDDIVFHK
ncbi:hypothetical protein B7P43_G03188 [Cryptotermes secundus]|uniref:Uncharacterized protein n=1 Tax=Cryptotermes secundus TaxID=105785 RepID=A0A2J7RTG1_9NEOP|nr:hypothetical protein B7P43_G03188 [Cryptotermes secundus]